MADAARSSVRKKSAPSSSPGSTKRPIGVPARIFRLRGVGVPSFSKSRARFWAETRKPGAIALQRMPVPAKCVASHWVRLETAALAAEYAGILVSGM